jgi:hypothetical protein
MRSNGGRGFDRAGVRAGGRLLLVIWSSLGQQVDVQREAGQQSEQPGDARKRRVGPAFAYFFVARPLVGEQPVGKRLAGSRRQLGVDERELGTQRFAHRCLPTVIGTGLTGYVIPGFSA